MGRRKIGDGFDPGVCSHFLWQMEYLVKHPEKMKEVIKRHVSLKGLHGGIIRQW